MNDYDTSLAFFGERVPPNKIYPQIVAKDAMARLAHSIWFFRFLHHIIQIWVGSYIEQVMGLRARWNVVAYQLSLGDVTSPEAAETGYPCTQESALVRGLQFLPPY